MHALLDVIKLVCKPMATVVLSRCPSSCIGPAPRNAPATLQPGGRPPEAGRPPAVLPPPWHAPAWHAFPRGMHLSNFFPNSACPSQACVSFCGKTRLCIVQIFSFCCWCHAQMRDVSRAED